MTGLKRKPRFSECLGNERNPETVILALHAERTRIPILRRLTAGMMNFAAYAINGKSYAYR